MCRLHDRAISITTTLDTLAVNARSARTTRDSVLCLLSPIIVDVLEIERMEVAGEVAVIETLG